MPCRSLLRFFSFTLLILSFTVGASAQFTPVTPRLSDDELLAMYDARQIADYRDAFRKVLATDSELLSAMGKEDAAQYLRQRAAVIDAWPDVDVARLLDRNVDLTPLLEATERLNEIVKRDKEEALKIATSSDGLPDAEYSFCGSTRNNAVGMLAAQVVFDVAKAVWAGLSRACEEDIGGFNLSLACIPVDIVLFGAESVFRAFQFCDNDIDSAEIEGSYERLAHVHGDLVSAEAAIKSLITISTTNIINNDNSNRDLVINNDNSNRDLVINNNNANRDLIIINNNANRDLIIAELRRIGCDIIRLLNTPEGQRSSENAACEGQPGYPYDFPEKK